MSSGELRARIAFDRRTTADDGAGNTVGDWEEQFTLWGAIIPRLGGEAVMASRLGGTQPVTLRVRYSSQAVQVTTDWRARHVGPETIYNIRSVADLDGRKRYIDMLAETGVAT